MRAHRHLLPTWAPARGEPSAAVALDGWRRASACLSPGPDRSPYRYELRAGRDGGENVASLRIRLLRSSQAEADGERWFVKASPAISRVVATSAVTGKETARLERIGADWKLVLADAPSFDWIQARDGWTLASTIDGSLHATSVHRQGGWYALSADYVLDPGWPSRREALLVLLFCTLAQAFLHGPRRRSRYGSRNRELDPVSEATRIDDGSGPFCRRMDSRAMRTLALALVTVALAGCGGDVIVEPVTSEETIPATVPQAAGEGEALTCLDGNGADVDPYEPDDDRNAAWYTVTLPENSAIIALHASRDAAGEHADELGDESIGYAYVSWDHDPSAAETNLFTGCLDY